MYGEAAPAFSPDDYVQLPPWHENAAPVYGIIGAITYQGAAGVKFTREAREFAVRNLARYQRHLSDARGQNRMRATEQPAP
jgi:hypothetical protein